MPTVGAKNLYIVKLAYLPLPVLPREVDHSASWFYCFSLRKAAWTEVHSVALKDCKDFFAVASRIATLACSLQYGQSSGKSEYCTCTHLFLPGVQGLCPVYSGVHKGLPLTPFVCYS